MTPPTHAQSMLFGHPEAWASPLAAMILFTDPGSPGMAAGARLCLQRGWTPPTAVMAAEAWWWNETDARLMCNYITTLGLRGDHGSAPHRRAVHVAVLCARTVNGLCDASLSYLDMADRWLSGEDVPIADGGKQPIMSAVYTVYEVYARDAHANPAVTAANSHAAHASALIADLILAKKKEIQARAEHLATLADLIRTHYSTLPLPEPP